MDITFSAITRFFQERARDIRRIANGTRGEVEVDGVESEAWLAAVDISKKRGFPIDFNDPADQETLLGRLYNRLVKFAEKNVRFAVRLDVDWDKYDSADFGCVLARILTAPSASDPAARLQQLQEASAATHSVQLSYSEASAYTLLLLRFEWEMMELAAHLRIALATLRFRLRSAVQGMKIQPSLFDGVEVIDPGFEPTLARARVEVPRVEIAGHQREWKF